MEALLLLVSLFFGLGGTLTKKVFTNKTDSNLTYIFLFNALSGVIATVFFFCFNGFSSISAYSFWLGLLFGFVTAMQGIFMMLALQVGPMSFTIVAVNFSTGITALLGAWFWQEEIQLLQIFGLILSVVSFVLAMEKSADEKKMSFKWALFSVLALLLTSGIGLLQKLHQSSVYKEELDGFLLIAFAFLSVFSICLAVFFKKREKVALFPEKKTGGVSWLLIAVMLITGIFVAVPNKLNLYLSGVIDSVIFFPIVNGGNLILSTLLAFVLFKEKLTKKQWFGLLLGILSFALLCIPVA